MPDEDSDDTAFQDQIADQLAFEARFPLKAFEPMLRALNLSATPQNLERVRGWLMPYLYHSFSDRPVNEPSRSLRIAKLRGLRDAMALVRAALPPRGSIMDLPWTLRDVGDGVAEKFLATLDRLYRSTEKRLKELEATPARRGRKPKTEFRDFAPDLTWVYERMTGSEARKPYWLPDSGIYSGEFYNFAVAVWRCLRSYVPEVKDALPTSEVALAQELQDHWPQKDTATG